MKSNLIGLLQLLSRSSVDFILIGDFASVVYESTMVTRVVHICMNLNKLSINKLRQLLSSYNPVHRMHPEKISFLKRPENITTVQNLYLNTKIGTLDILSQVKGLGSFDDIKTNSQLINITPDDRIRILSKEQLILSKKELGRPKDLRVIEELERL